MEDKGGCHFCGVKARCPNILVLSDHEMGELKDEQYTIEPCAMIPSICNDCYTMVQELFARIIEGKSNKELRPPDSSRWG